MIIKVAELRLLSETVCYSVVSDSLRPHMPVRLLCPWDSTGQEYWSEWPCHPSGDFPGPGIEPGSHALQADSLPSEPPGKPEILQVINNLRSTIWRTHLCDFYLITFHFIQGSKAVCCESSAVIISDFRMETFRDGLTFSEHSTLR